MSNHATLAIAFCATVLALAILAKAAPSLGLMDHPRGHKTHTESTPVVGGVGIVMVLFGFELTVDIGPVSPWLYGGIAASALLGLIDDVKALGAKSKLAVMLVIFAVTLEQSDTVLTSLGELWPGKEVILGAWALPFTLFAAVGVINAFNLIDGMDGLAGTVALCTLVGYLILATLISATEWVPILAVLIGASMAFLAFNLRVSVSQPARLFLGDAGSLVMGLLVFWLAVDLSQRPGGVSPMVMVWLLALPMLDTIATMLLRILEGKSIFTPGRDHFHHLLLACGASVERIVLLAALFSVSSGTTGLLLWLTDVPEWLSMSAFLVLAVIYVLLHVRAWSKLGRGKRNAQLQEARPERFAGQ